MGLDGFQNVVLESEKDTALKVSLKEWALAVWVR